MDFIAIEYDKNLILCHNLGKNKYSYFSFYPLQQIVSIEKMQQGRFSEP
jgi:hypothetical protein